MATPPDAALDPLPSLVEGALPPVEWLDAGELPVAERRLLAHDCDMTPTMDAFAGEPVGLKRIHSSEEGDCLLREVLLTRPSTGEALLYGAIRIHLAGLPDAAREDILSHRIPLGRILAERNIPHGSHPEGFFRVKGFPTLIDLWPEVHAETWCHARRNVLRHASGDVLAEVVEIVPPLATDG